MVRGAYYALWVGPKLSNLSFSTIRGVGDDRFRQTLQREGIYLRHSNGNQRLSSEIRHISIMLVLIETLDYDPTMSVVTVALH